MPDRRGDGGRPERGVAAGTGSAAVEADEATAGRDRSRVETDGDRLVGDGGRIESDSSRVASDGGRVESGGSRVDRLRGEAKRTFDPEELRRRNLSAVVIDVLYLFTTAFLATLFVRGVWQAVIASAPLAALLYFAWRSTTAFLVAQLLVIALTVVATYAGLLPL